MHFAPSFLYQRSIQTMIIPPRPPKLSCCSSLFRFLVEFFVGVVVTPPCRLTIPHPTVLHWDCSWIPDSIDPVILPCTSLLLVTIEPLLEYHKSILARHRALLLS